MKQSAKDRVTNFYRNMLACKDTPVYRIELEIQAVKQSTFYPQEFVQECVNILESGLQQRVQ